MGRIIKAVFVLAVLGFVGLAAYAYFFQPAPAQSEVRVPVVLDAD